MTSMPASRSALATTLAPRSCPSSPGLATTTRMRPCATVPLPLSPSPAGPRFAAGPHLARYYPAIHPPQRPNPGEDDRRPDQRPAPAARPRPPGPDPPPAAAAAPPGPCPVEAAGAGFARPCTGQRWDAGGAPAAGPGQAAPPLRPVPTSLAGGALYVDPR